MNHTCKILILLTFFILQSCAKEKNKTVEITEVSQKLEMISIYNQAVDSMQKGDNYFAAKKFLESELAYPQSIWAPKSSIMASYTFYLDEYYSDAIFNLERYMKIYPKDNRMDYAQYLLAMCYFEQVTDGTRDTKPIINARQKFNTLIKNYPNGDFAIDATFKISLLEDILASKEMYIGRHYLKKEKWIAAINRFKNVINNYEETIYIEEAIHRLVEIY